MDTLKAILLSSPIKILATINDTLFGIHTKYMRVTWKEAVAQGKTEGPYWRTATQDELLSLKDKLFLGKKMIWTRQTNPDAPSEAFIMDQYGKIKSINKQDKYFIYVIHNKEFNGKLCTSR